MKKALLFVLALVASGCADPIPRNLDDLVQQGDTYLDRETMRPHSGPAFRFFPNDTTRIERRMKLKDGKRHGPYEEYRENGQLQLKTNYVAGERDGQLEYYDENGQLRSKTTYVAGERLGPYELYHENGQLAWRGTYNMGEECGEWIEDGETVTYDPCPLGLVGMESPPEKSDPG